MKQPTKNVGCISFAQLIEHLKAGDNIAFDIIPEDRPLFHRWLESLKEDRLARERQAAAGDDLPPSTLTC